MNYITRNKEGIIIDGPHHCVQVGIRHYVDQLCLTHGSSLDGRIASARYLLQRKSLLPIVVNKDICLIPNTSFRQMNLVLLNYYQIASVQAKSTGCNVSFLDGNQVFISVPKSQLQRQLEYTKRLLNQIE